MELDYSSVKALSSPTRIQILSEIMTGEMTPTDLSRSLGRSKSTVSSHLSKLEDAGLVERDEEEGRRRVTYSATRKAEAIVKGKEKKVKFSVVSSVISAVAGVALLSGFPWSLGQTAAAERQQVGSLAYEAGKAGGEAARESAGIALHEPIFLGAGILALLAAALAIAYALVLHRLQ